MFTRASKILFDLSAGFSLALFLISAAGYFGTLGIHTDVWQPSPGIFVERFSLDLSRGSVEFHKYSEPPFYIGPRAVGSTGWNDGQFGLAGFKSLFRIDFQQSRVSKWGVTATSFAVLFPIWCVQLPCLIAPLLWWRKRGVVPQRGFDVQLSDP